MTVPGGWRSSRRSAMILAKLPGGKSAKSGIRRKTVARESITIMYLPRRGTSGKHEQEGGHCPPYSLEQIADAFTGNWIPAFAGMTLPRFSPPSCPCRRASRPSVSLGKGKQNLLYGRIMIDRSEE